MLVQEPVQGEIWNCLNHYDYTNAIFLAERLRATDVDSDETLFLLATCYYRAGKKMQAYSTLKSKRLNSAKCKFLMGKCCVDLEKMSEAELALTGGDMNRFQNLEVEDVIKEYGDESQYVLQLLGRIYVKTERIVQAINAYCKTLKICPYLWQSFKMLCDLGENPDPAKIFHLSNATSAINHQHHTDTISTTCSNTNLNAVVGANWSPMSMNTPVAVDAVSNTPPSGCGMRTMYVTPEDSQYQITRPPAPMKQPIKPKYTNFNFNQTPIAPTTIESTPISEVGGAIPIPIIESETKFLNKRPLGRKEQVTPLQVAKPVIYNHHGGNVGALASNTAANITPPPLLNVRRSSRITNNSVKENNKSPKFSSPKSPSRKSKTIRTTKGSKSAFSELHEKNKQSSDSPIIVENTMPFTTLNTHGNINNNNNNGGGYNNPNIASLNNLTFQHRQQSVVEELMALLRGFGTAYVHLAHYDLPKALEYFQELPVAQQNSALVLSYCGKAHVELHQYKEAVKCFERVREMEPFRDEMMEIYSTALWLLRKEKELSLLAHELLECDRYSPYTWCAAGNCVSLHKEHDVAIKFFERAVQLDSEFAYAHTLLGHEYVVTEELDKAITCFRHALRIDPRHYNAWYGLGSIYMKQEKFHLAEIHLKKALSIHPTSTVIMCIIGVVQKNLQRPRTALDTLNEALQINPKSAICKFHRATLYYSDGRYTEALAELTELQELVPKESEVFYLTARVHKKLGNDHLSSMYVSWGTDLDPKGANSQFKETSDLLINHATVPDIAPEPVSPSEQDADVINDANDDTNDDDLEVDTSQDSIMEQVDMDETM